ncbi:MAG: acylphosphatase [Candidatus Neomarinimicrobiota bacterium]
MKAFKATVSGKVQGVWFRDSTQEEAIKLKVTGWVKNIPGGMVYLEAEGEENNLKSLERWIHIGSPHSRVDRVDLQWIVPTNKYSTFKVIF